MRNESHLFLACPPRPHSHPPHCSRKHPSRPFPLHTHSIRSCCQSFLSDQNGLLPYILYSFICNATYNLTVFPRESSSSYSSGAASSHSHCRQTLTPPPTDGHLSRSGRLAIMNRAGVCTLTSWLVHALVRPMVFVCPLHAKPRARRSR